ncbi:hypothetical protein [Haloarchaeobius sp. DYHT-AS-18]|uniref:hypothetical protein n=1 Tax=Haloarchaeobius sp. DYHT-AS-18 TaxID=3446117 RepID=UPI003EBC96EF
MSGVDTTKLALRGVGAVLVVSGIRILTEFTVGYAPSDWLTTVLFFGILAGYYSVEG